MAQLTWRNVDTPNFAPAAALQEAAASRIAQAIRGAQEGVATFRDARQADASEAVMARMLALQDPARYQAALADGSLTAGARVTPELAATIQAGLGSRLANAATGQRARLTDQEIAFNEANNPLRIQSSQQTLDQGKFNLGRDQHNFQTQLTNEADQKAAEGALAVLNREAIDGSGARRLLFTDKRFTSLNPAVQNTLLNRVNSQYGASDAIAGAAGIGGSGVPGAVGSDATRVMNYQARAAGFNSVPDSVTTLGGARQFALQVNRAGVPSSAMGTYQIVGDTLERYAPRVFGKDWQNQPFTQESQDRIAEAIFNDNRGSAAALRKQWVSLSEGQARALVGKTWNEARNIIAAGESGSVPGGTVAAGQAGQIQSLARQATGNQAGQSGFDSHVAAGFTSAFQDANKSTFELADKYLGKGKQFEGMDRGAWTDRVNDLARKYQVAPSVAAYAMSESAVKNSVWNKVKNPGAVTWNFGGSQAIDMGKASFFLEQAARGPALDGIANQQYQQQLDQQRSVATQNLMQAEASLAAAQREAAVRGGGVDLSFQIQRVNEARNALARITQNDATNPNQLTRRAPAPVAQSRGATQGQERRPNSGRQVGWN